jgi:hypothetical protein
MMSGSESTVTFTSRLVFNHSRDAQRRAAPRMVYLAAVLAKLRAVAPYAAILVLPGGSLMTLLLWLYRRQNRGCGAQQRD